MRNTLHSLAFLALGAVLATAVQSSLADPTDPPRANPPATTRENISRALDIADRVTEEVADARETDANWEYKWVWSKTDESAEELTVAGDGGYVVAGIGPADELGNKVCVLMKRHASHHHD